LKKNISKQAKTHFFTGKGPVQRCVRVCIVSANECKRNTISRNRFTEYDLLAQEQIRQLIEITEQQKHEFKEASSAKITLAPPVESLRLGLL